MKIPSYIQKPLNAILTTYFKYVLAAVVVLIGTAGYFILIKPQFENVRLVGVLAYQNASDQLFNRQSYYLKAKAMVDSYHEVSAAQPVKIEDIVPTKIDNSKLFLTLQALTQQAGMSVVSMALSKGTAVTGATTSAAAVAGTKGTSASTGAITTSSGTVKTINVTLSMTGPGDYESFKKLLTTIEQSMRIFDLGTISYVPLGTTVGTQAAQAQPMFSFELKTYYLDQSTTK